MEKFMQRENRLLGYAHQAFPVNSPKTPHGSSDDMDFNDVFGGPPRRSSVQEVRLRYSFGEPMESEEEIASLPWSSRNEKPVFGEESRTPRRRHHRGDDFFQDIFKGDESYSSPRRADRDRDNTFGSNPGSRTLSPSRPLPPKAEPFCISSPTQFRFSGQVTKIQDEIRSNVHPVCHQSPLSHEASFSSEDQPPVVTSDQKENKENLEDRRNVENLGNQFHFSFYKWAGMEVAIPLRLVGRSNMKPQDSSIYGRPASPRRRDNKSSTVTKNEGLPAIGLEYLQTEHKREDLGNEEEIKDQANSIIEEGRYEIPESKSENSANNAVVFGVDRQNIKDEHVKSLDKIDMQEKTEKIAPQKNEEPVQSELKPLALLSDEVEQPGNIAEMKGNQKRISKGIHTGSHDGKNVKENGGIGIHSNYETIDKSSLHAAAINSGVTPGENGVKRRVREFVQIFNQEADSGPKANFQTSQSSRWKAAGIDQIESDESLNAAKDKVNLHYSDKNPDISVKVDENLNKDEAQHHSPAKTPTIDRSSNQKNAFSSDMCHSDSTIHVEHFDDALEDDFLVQELSNDHEKGSEGPEDTKAIDANIRQWSFGKKGNIRSLLSTLQFVLWPGSGWKPVPLANLIETNSVKRAYQKALLRLHPDKLQQKDAAFHQKYIAEKVFDILQEAWDQFNALAPLTM